MKWDSGSWSRQSGSRRHVDSLLEMCRRLGYNSIIEGVEDSKVADIVGDLNATLLQGYHYSHPICREDFEKILHEDRKQRETHSAETHL